ncbi:hypothetical protein [Photorhabdus aegyptia]|uniref:hypothetical protein n=1 Tax=Photorhabdus aegyptia TaxID=2805098 RepID=UPI001E36D6FA|nr:hypothetical protein [Photorhabdus aegyptia]
MQSIEGNIATATAGMAHKGINPKLPAADGKNAGIRVRSTKANFDKHRNVHGAKATVVCLNNAKTPSLR